MVTKKKVKKNPSVDIKIHGADKIMKSCDTDKKYCSGCCNSGCGYGLGVLGAAIYYISTATGFWVGVLGVLKSLVWPAFLVYELLKFLGA